MTASPPLEQPACRAAPARFWAALARVAADDAARPNRWRLPWDSCGGALPPAAVPYGPNERWLSMVAPEEPDGVRLVHLTDEPARAFQVAATAAAAAAVADVSRNVFRREGEYWTISYEGAVVHLKDAKGLRHLARLLTHPGREFHAVDLEAAEGQAGPLAPVGPGGRTAGGGEGLVVRPDLGDAGMLLDATAKAAYQARIQELRGEVEEAEGFNDPARATKARQELGFLVAELARAVGLGGRDRRAASHAERARLNVTRTIRAAMANLARANPALGRHLAVTVRTGRYCAYTPDPRLPITWERWPGQQQRLARIARPSGGRRIGAGRSRGTGSRRPWEAPTVLIRLWIADSQPLVGTAATEGSEPRRFDGWLELLRVVSELVTVPPSSDEDADAAG